MSVTYETKVIGYKNHASIAIPDEVLAELGTNRRAPLKVTINGYTYQSTATAVNGECRVVFPQKDRDAAGAQADDIVVVTLELDSGVREVDMPEELTAALETAGFADVFEELSYSKRKEFARQVSEAKAEETKAKRITKVLAELTGNL
jgi:bifunctional DNA-binding transcriptional regulator/antitoxin component of YhaV-PrlF toxin-antitoxin module